MWRLFAKNRKEGAVVSAVAKKPNKENTAWNWLRAGLARILATLNYCCLKRNVPIKDINLSICFTRITGECCSKISWHQTHWWNHFNSAEKKKNSKWPIDMCYSKWEDMESEIYSVVGSISQTFSPAFFFTYYFPKTDHYAVKKRKKNKNTNKIQDFLKKIRSKRIGGERHEYTALSQLFWTYFAYCEKGSLG